MLLNPIDLIIIGTYLIVTLIIGIVFARRGTESIQDFFVSGRKLPWWLAGTTMIASAFAIDTPIGITGMVANHGISGVWYAWSFVLGGAGMLGAFVFSAMLRRSCILSPAEIAELRYDGSGAAVLRLFKSFYFGVFANAWTLGWIIKAVTVICEAIVPDVNTHLIVTAILLFTLAYTALSGLWGIAATDFIQFIIGTAGSFTLLYFTWQHFDGIEHIIQGMAERYGTEQAQERLNFFPRMSNPFFATFLVFITLKWWGNPPPAILQRIIASKNEIHASKATFLFSIVAFGFNYWPMILVALASLVMYPELSAAETSSGVGYAKLIAELLPQGLLGLMLASLIAAFMSTVDTHINYGASYLVNDLYKRFLRPNASVRHYVRISQLATVLMLLIAVAVSNIMDSVADAWYAMSMMTAGYAFVMVLRWFWWRINAWSEISALLSAMAGSIVMYHKTAKVFGYWESLSTIPWAYRYLMVFALSSLAWIITTFYTRPCKAETLEHFCRKVSPFAFGWKPIAQKYKNIEWKKGFKVVLLQWVLGAVSVFSFNFAIGNLLFLKISPAILLGVISMSAMLSAFYLQKKIR